MKLNINHDEKHISFRKEDGTFLGETNYTSEIWDNISSVNWYVNEEELEKEKKTYIYTGSKKFNGYNKLHQVVMLLWYGVDKLIEAYNRDFIVEHHDNVAFNCNIENLSFAHKSVNIAKAHTYDKERIPAKPYLAINFYKDFKTQKYQITVALNKKFDITAMDGYIKDFTALHLVYNDDFRIVFQDASNLLYTLVTYKKFDLRMLQFIDAKFTENILVYPINDEELPSFLEIDGKPAVVLSDKLRIDRLAPKKDLY